MWGNYGWSTVAKFNEIILRFQQNIYIFNEIIILIQRIIYIFSRNNYLYIQQIVYIFNEIIIYVLNEIMILIQRIIYIFNERIIFIQPHTHQAYGQRNINLKIEIWSLFCMDLQKEQDANTHGSGWMLIICKHWNWNLALGLEILLLPYKVWWRSVSDSIHQVT